MGVLNVDNFLIIWGFILVANHFILYGRLLDISELPFCHGFTGLVLISIGLVGTQRIVNTIKKV